MSVDEDESSPSCESSVESSSPVRSRKPKPKAKNKSAPTKIIGGKKRSNMNATLANMASFMADDDDALRGGSVVWQHDQPEFRIIM